MRKAILISGDEQEFTMDFEVAKKMLPQIAERLTSSLEGYEHEENKPAVTKIKIFQGCILKLIVEWAEHHKDDPVPKDPSGFVLRSEVIDYWEEWDQKFVRDNKDSLEKLEKAAEYFCMMDLYIAVRIALGKGYMAWLENILQGTRI